MHLRPPLGQQGPVSVLTATTGGAPVLIHLGQGDAFSRPCWCPQWTWTSMPIWFLAGTGSRATTCCTCSRRAVWICALGRRDCSWSSAVSCKRRQTSFYSQQICRRAGRRAARDATWAGHGARTGRADAVVAHGVAASARCSAARSPFSLTMCFFRVEICPVYAMLAFTSKARLNQTMHPCRSSFALPKICRNKTFQVANIPAASCLEIENQKLPALSDIKFLLILAYSLHHSLQESTERLEHFQKVYIIYSRTSQESFELRQKRQSCRRLEDPCGILAGPVSWWIHWESLSWNYPPSLGNRRMWCWVAN